MGKTPSPGKWIKSLLGKKSSKSSLEKLRSVKKEEEVVVKVKDNNVSTLPTDDSPELVSSQEVAAVTIPQEQPSHDIGSVESRNDTEGVKLDAAAATEAQAACQVPMKANEELQTLKGIVKLQAVTRGHLVRRQAVATYSCIFGVVKLQALARGKKARCLETGSQLQKTHTVTESSETLQESTCSWMGIPTKLSMIDKLLVSSPTALPLKIRYGPEDSNSATEWLQRWTQLRVWAPGPLVVKNLVPKSQTKKRSFEAVETEKGKLKRGIKKPSDGSTTGNSSRSNRSTDENGKPKRTVRKASSLGKEPSRIENDKAKQSSRKSTSAIKEGSSSLEVKDEKPRVSLKKSSVSNGIEKATTRKSAEKKKEIAELPVDKVSASVAEAPEDGTMKVIPETTSKEADLDKHEKVEISPERNDKAEEEIQQPEVQIISPENGNTKASDRRASLPAKIENHHQDDGHTQSGRKIPSYMAPTASAKARVRGQGSPRLVAQEKPEKNGTTTRRHSLPPAANGKLGTMSPRAHRLLIASAKGSMNSDRSFSSSRDIGDGKSAKAEWKR